MGKVAKSQSKAKAVKAPAESAGVEASVIIPAEVTVRVIKAHDGLEVGDAFIKPREVAYMMCEMGFWEILK